MASVADRIRINNRLHAELSDAASDLLHDVADALERQSADIARHEDPPA